MSIELTDIDKLDIQKIHNEINQLHNHQFLITIAALSFFGGSMVWLLPEKSVLGQTGKVNTAGFSIGLTIGLLFVMGLLFYWLTRLSRMMARLSTYLAEKSFSDLEVMHARYVSTFPKDVSQRATMATVFLVLGLFAASLLSAFLIWGPYAFDAASPIQPQVWWLLLTLALLIYISIVGYLGFRNTWEDRAALENRWKEVFRQAKSQAKT